MHPYHTVSKSTATEAGKLIDLNCYRQELGLSSWAEPAPPAPRRRSRPQKSLLSWLADSMDLCASFAVVVMTLTMVIQFVA